MKKILLIILMFAAFSATAQISDEALQDTIDYYIKTNNSKAITAAQLNRILTHLNTNKLNVDSVGAAADFTLTTTGTSGPSTYTGGVLNIPVYSSGSGGSSPWRDEWGMLFYPPGFNNITALFAPDDSIVGIERPYFGDIQRKLLSGNGVYNLLAIKLQPNNFRMVADKYYEIHSSWFRGNVDSINAYLVNFPETKRLIVDTITTMNDDWNIPADKIIEFKNGGYITASSTVDLNADNTTVVAGDVKIFGSNVNLYNDWNAETIYPEWFGTVGDGVTNDYAALNKFFQFLNICTYNNAYLGLEKTYKINTGLNVIPTKNLNLDCRGSILLADQNDYGASDDLLYIYQTAKYSNSTYILGADIAEGTTTVTLNTTTGLSVGDMVKIFGGIYGQENLAGHAYHKFIISKIDKIVDGTTIILVDASQFNINKDSVNYYRTTVGMADAGVTVYNPIKVTVENLGLDIANYHYSDNKLSGIMLRYFYEPVLRNIWTLRKGYLVISASNNYNATLDHIVSVPNPLTVRTGSGTITSYTNYGSTVPGTVKATCSTAHGLTTGDEISLTSSASSYNGAEKITVIDATSFYFYDTYVSAQSGSWDVAIDNYGILVGAGAKGLITNSNIRTGTHCVAFTTNGATYGFRIENSYFKSALFAATALDSHGSRDIHVSNSEFYGIQVGFGYASVDNCMIMNDHGGINAFGERGGTLVDKSMGIEWRITNSTIKLLDPYVQTYGLDLYTASGTSATYPTSTFYMANCQIYSDAVNGTDLVGSGDEIKVGAIPKDVIIENCQFRGPSTFVFPQVRTSGRYATSGSFIFRNNTYEYIKIGNAYNSTLAGELQWDRFKTIIIDGNLPCKPTARFWIVMKAKPVGELIVKNNTIVSQNIIVSQMTYGSQLWDNNTFYTVANQVASGYGLVSAFTLNTNSVFTNNNIMTGRWIISGTINSYGNRYNNYNMFDNQSPENYYDFVNNTAATNTGVTLTGSDFTINAKVKINSNGSNVSQPIIGNATSGYTAFSFKSIDATHGSYKIFYNGTASNFTWEWTNATQQKMIVEDTLWHTFTIKVQSSANRLTVYRDGVAFMDTINSNITTLDAGGGNIQVGFNEAGATDEYFKGKIASFSMYNRALTDYEISKVINNDNTQYANCIMNLGSVKQQTTWFDNSINGRNLTIGTDKATNYKTSKFTYGDNVYGLATYTGAGYTLATSSGGARQQVINLSLSNNKNCSISSSKITLAKTGVMDIQGSITIKNASATCSTFTIVAELYNSSDTKLSEVTVGEPEHCTTGGLTIPINTTFNSTNANNYIVLKIAGSTAVDITVKNVMLKISKIDE